MKKTKRRPGPKPKVVTKTQVSKLERRLKS